jgi:hypothetical protein
MTTLEGGAASLQTQLQGLHDSLAHLFTMRRQAQARSRTQLHRELLRGLELMWQIDEQVVLPVLHDPAAHAAADVVRQADDELSLMRNLAMLATRTNPRNRDLALAVLEGLSMLHYARLDRLLGDTPSGAADWQALDSEVRSMLRRWSGQVPARVPVVDVAEDDDDEEAGDEDGDEDEDADPVGRPPR